MYLNFFSFRIYEERGNVPEEPYLFEVNACVKIQLRNPNEYVIKIHSRWQWLRCARGCNRVGKQFVDLVNFAASSINKMLKCSGYVYIYTVSKSCGVLFFCVCFFFPD